MDGTALETCDACGFDAARWNVRDAASLLGGLGTWWRLATDGLTRSALNARPSPGVWSALEYGIHTALVTAMLREGVQRILAEDGVSLPAPPAAPDASSADEPLDLDPAAIVRDVEREAGALQRLAKEAPDEAWSRTGRTPDGQVQARAALLHAVHDASHHLMDVAAGLAVLGAGTPPASGTVVQVNTSNGGVPKHPVGRADVDHRGIVGDRQKERKHHGRPFQALCLWSAEVIDELASLGHPIGYGCAGENLTISGIDWSTIRPGARLRIGTVLAEVSFVAVPCKKQVQWFDDGDFNRISFERNPQWVRWYAWVREPGAVSDGDAVVVPG